MFFCRRRSLPQRGATLTGYALLMSAMVAVSLGALRGLDEGSTEVLEATGDSIGEARPTRDQLALLVTEEDPNDITGPPTPPVPTYDWSSSYTGVIQTPEGFCVVDNGGVLETAVCTTAASGEVEFFDNLDDDTDEVQIRANGLCVTRVSTNSPAVLAACQDGNADQMWLQTPSGNLANGGAPGECLDVDGANASSAGATMFNWGCHGNANQTFSFPGPYVPPVTAVLSVPSTSATLTGAFVLDGNGLITAPNGSGNSYNSPGTSIATATFTFTVEDAGDYRISGSTIAPNGADDSFWVTTSLDGNATGYMWGVDRSSSPQADFVNTNNGGGPDAVLTIPAGTTFTITVSVREDGTSLESLTLVPV